MYKALKATLDFFFAFLGLLICTPLFLCISLAIVLDSKGSPYLHQMRRGKDGKLFCIYKFRTMYQSDVPFDVACPVRAADDTNVTKVGRFLRRTKLDELLQLINVLKGDMSLVGPRPLLPDYDEGYEEWEKRKYAVRPGMTGLAQVNGNGLLSTPERSYYDVKYAGKVTFGMDCKIMFRTLKVILMGEEKCLRHVPQEELDAMRQEK